MLRWTLYVVAGAILLVLLVAITGYMLPVAHHASRTVRLSRPAPDVFGVISDFERHAEWRSDVQRVTVTGAGSAALVREESSEGVIPFRVEVFEPPARLRMRIEDQSLPFGGTWTYTLTPVDGGTELTLAEDGEVYNPIFRFLARFVFGHHATIDRYLADLKRRLD